MAPQRFGKWSDTQLLREQDDVTPTTPLFHYTDRDALEGITKEPASLVFQPCSTG
jgi:hypothetical protein